MYSRHILVFLFDQTMAEPTSPSSTIRSSHRPLEYTSCINTKPLSISTCGNINAHSSFDTIGQPDHDSYLETTNLPHHRLLERELCRLNIDSDRYKLEMNNKKLDRTESISLPTTPIEQISSSLNHTCHSLLALQTNDNNNDEKEFSLISSTDYMIVTSEQLTNQSITDSER
jgi:hypothetical protein